MQIPRTLREIFTPIFLVVMCIALAYSIEVSDNLKIAFAEQKAPWLLATVLNICCYGMFLLTIASFCLWMVLQLCKIVIVIFEGKPKSNDKDRLVWQSATLSEAGKTYLLKNKDGSIAYGRRSEKYRAPVFYDAAMTYYDVVEIMEIK